MSALWGFRLAQVGALRWCVWIQLLLQSGRLAVNTTMLEEFARSDAVKLPNLLCSLIPEGCRHFGIPHWALHSGSLLSPRGITFDHAQLPKPASVTDATVRIQMELIDILERFVGAFERCAFVPARLLEPHAAAELDREVLTLRDVVLPELRSAFRDAASRIDHEDPIEGEHA